MKRHELPTDLPYDRAAPVAFAGDGFDVLDRRDGSDGDPAPYCVLCDGGRCRIKGSSVAELLALIARRDP